MRFVFKFDWRIQVVLYLVLFLLICSLLISLYIKNYFHIFDACNDRIIHSNESISSLHTAVQYVRDCGATTDYVTHIKIQNDGNGEYEIVFTAKGSTTAKDMSLAWLDDKHLEVQIYNELKYIDVFKTESRGVVIDYIYNGRAFTSEDVKRVNNEPASR